MASNPGDNNSSAAPADWSRKVMKGIPASLGALWTQRDENGWRYAVQLDESHANAQGFIHGGVLMTFLDHALSLLVWEATDRAMCSTVQLDSHFLSSVRPPVFIQLEGKILKESKSLIFVRGVLRAGEKPVMEASGMWSVIRPEKN